MAKYVERALRKFPTVLGLNAGNISKTCKKLKISRSTYERLLETNKEFREACFEVREALLDYTEDKAMELVREGNPQMIMFVLKTQGKSRGWVERTEVDARVQEDIRIVVRD